VDTALAAPVFDVAAVVTHVTDQLTAAGIRACADTRDLNPPAVYVGAPTVQYGRLAAWTAQLTVYAVAPNAGRLDALTVLGPLLGQVFDVLGPTTATPFDLIVHGAPDPLPSYRCTYTLTIRPD
jgi:hypothetical protein